VQGEGPGLRTNGRKDTKVETDVWTEADTFEVEAIFAGRLMLSAGFPLGAVEAELDAACEALAEMRGVS